MKQLPRALLAQIVAIPALAVAIAVAFLYLPGQAAALQYIVVVVLSYLVGSLSWGYMLLRWRQGTDVREYGSGRTGMSNVLRTGGGRMAAVVGTLDIGKGVLAVMMAKEATGASGAEVAAALAAVTGHNWPVFLGFRGGRGILAALGGLSMMAPVPAVVATAIWLATALGSRYISLGSILGVVAGAASLIGLVALAGWYSQAYIIFAGVAAVMIIWQHRDNIQRLIQGNERRIGAPAAPVE
jgi:glycerol-3-phosphate acyltransferase PlsY